MADDPSTSAASHDDPATPDGRARISTLADELLPALIARLSASSLGELEIREGNWRVRLRRAPVQVELQEPLSGRGRIGGRSHPASAPSDGAVDQAGPATRASATSQSPARDPGRAHATSPAVGYYSPRDGIGVGQSVRAGDLLGHIDVLGVRQEVVSPIDGLVTRQLAESGEAVEYGQELVRLERLLKGGTRQVGDAEAVAVTVSTASEAGPSPSLSAAPAGAVGGAAPTNGAAPSGARPADVGLVATIGGAPDAASS